MTLSTIYFYIARKVLLSGIKFQALPSQILRNSASNWFDSYQQFFKQKDRGRPKRKRKGEGMSILLTRELFRFDHTSEGLKLFIGTLRNNIGYLNIN